MCKETVLSAATKPRNLTLPSNESTLALGRVHKARNLFIRISTEQAAKKSVNSINASTGSLYWVEISKRENKGRDVII